jgi:hypothetical protein
MPSTYTLNNGIELIATGEQSGTWGDTTNVNLALIDTALDGQVTITLASAGSSGSPNALPISDGSASNGRNRLVIFDDGGDLGATAFVQLTPNDAEKIVYIRNNLSGGRAITLFQGTYNASNDYEVPAGTTAVVFFNGGGAGAVAANVFNNAFFDSLRLGGVSVTAILDEDNMASDSATALATQQSIKAYVDAQVGANNELSEVLANGNTSGGNDIQMTTTDEVQFRDTALTINSSVDGQLDIAADVELEIVAPTLDINASTAVTIDTTTMTMTGSVNVVGDLDVDNLNINGNSIISTNTDGNIALTPNGTGEVDISKVDIDGGTIDGTVIGGSTPAAISGTTGAFSSSGFPVVINSTNNNLFKLALQDTAATVGYIGASSAAAFAVGSSAAAELFRVSSTGSVGIGTTDFAVGKLAVDGDISINAAAAGRFTWNRTGAYLNWIESDGVAGNNFVRFGVGNAEAMRITSAGNVGIGTSSPAVKLTSQLASSGISGIASTAAALFENSGNSDVVIAAGTSSKSRIAFGDSGDWIAGRIDYDHSDNSMRFGTAGSGERLRIDASGNVGIGLTNPGVPLHVKGFNNGNVMIVDATGTAANYIFDVRDDGTSVMRVDPSGNLLVGGTTAGNAGTVSINVGNAGATAGGLQMWAGTAQTSFVQFGDESGTAANHYRGYMAYAHGSDSMQFGTASTERMRIDSSGNLLVGTTISTAAKSTVESGVNQNTLYLSCPSFNWFPIACHNTATSGDNVFAGFGTEASFTTRGSITYNRAGGLTAYNTTSDYRAKDIAGPISDASGAVLNLKPYMGTMKGATVERPMFVAHETQEIAPYAVTGEKDAVDGDGNPKYQQMDHSALVPLLTAALQEALQKIEALEARITALEA